MGQVFLVETDVLQTVLLDIRVWSARFLVEYMWFTFCVCVFVLNDRNFTYGVFGMRGVVLIKISMTVSDLNLYVCVIIM